MGRAKELPDGWAEYARELGVAFQRARHELGLSQEEVAYRAGISSYTYQKFEKGESRPGTPMNPRLATFVRVCEVLGIDLGRYGGPG